jgi:hypothetical protein
MSKLPVLPVIGVALGMNAILKERSLANRRPVQFVMGIIGCLVCTMGIALNLFHRLAS